MLEKDTSIIFFNYFLDISRGFGFITLKNKEKIYDILRTSHFIKGKEINCKLSIPKEKLKNKIITNRKFQNDINLTFSSFCLANKNSSPLYLRKMFVGGLLPSFTKKDLFNYFSQFGEIEKGIIMTDKLTGKSRGFGFIIFNEKETIDKIMKKGNCHILNGKLIECKRVKPKIQSMKILHEKEDFPKFNNYNNTFGNVNNKKENNEIIVNYSLKSIGKFLLGDKIKFGENLFLYQKYIPKNEIIFLSKENFNNLQNNKKISSFNNNFNNINNNNIRNHNNLTKINKQNNKKKVKSNSLKKDQLSIKQKPFEKEIENSNSNSNENERIITPLKATLSTRRKTGENSSKKEKIIYSNNISQSSIFSYNKTIKEIKKIETLSKKGYSGKGIKKINQDNYFIYKNFTHNPDNIFLGVCDGHGIVGHEVSYYIINNLPYELNKNFLENKINEIEKISINKINEIIEKTFNKINEKIINDPNIETTFSGSTCCSVIITPSKILCANVGDSRAILGKKIRENFYISKEISHDHKPNEKLEKNRILKNGGRVESYKDEKGNLIGPERVWKFNEDIPGLAMSRSFGDEIAHCVGVVCNPEILEIEFEDEDKFLIVASDGIWEFISSDEAVDILKDYYEDDDIENGVLELYKEARNRWIFEEEVIDDITLIVVFFE
jgi:serine/threonine protein phosphatase PrpC